MCGEPRIIENWLSIYIRGAKLPGVGLLKFAFVFFLISTQAYAVVKLNVLPENSSQSKVCFFSQRDFKGKNFCVPVGAQEADLALSGWNDRIRSIKISGPVHVTVYRDGNYAGDSLSLERTVPDLSKIPGNWDKQISGFIVYSAIVRQGVRSK
jgi:hypothetical protein